MPNPILGKDFDLDALGSFQTIYTP